MGIFLEITTVSNFINVLLGRTYLLNIYTCEEFIMSKIWGSGHRVVPSARDGFFIPNEIYNTDAHQAS